MLSIFLLIPLSLMLFVVAIWAIRYAVRSNQFEDLDNASQRIILGVSLRSSRSKQGWPGWRYRLNKANIYQ